MASKLSLAVQHADKRIGVGNGKPTNRPADQAQRPLGDRQLRFLDPALIVSGHTLIMAVYFECITRTSMSKSELFDLARNIDAHRDSMARSREQAIAGVTSGLISLGQEVTWRAWHFGLPLQMTSRITQMEPPDYFVDEQVKGPLKRFRHVHEFREDPAGTTMLDRIEFVAPFGPIGRLAEKLVLARYLQTLMETRNRHLAGGRAR